MRVRTRSSSINRVTRLRIMAAPISATPKTARVINHQRCQSGGRMVKVIVAGVGLMLPSEVTART